MIAVLVVLEVIDWTEMVKAVVGAAALVLVGYFGLLGARSTKQAADAANADVVTPAEQDSAAEAISKAAVALVQPYRDEVQALREEGAETKATAEAAVEEARLLRLEVRRWQSIARSLARSVVFLRSEVERLGGHLDPEPEEPAVLRVLEDNNGERPWRQS